MSADTEYKCRWCSKSFSRERTLASHMCEKKRRWMISDEPASRIAFQVWLDFMRHVSPHTKKERTMEDFVRSPDYVGFIKFANYLIDLKPVESNQFIQWLFKMNVRLGDWCKPGTYALYIQESSKRETVERAVERTLLTIKSYCDENSIPWQSFFQEVPAVVAMNMVSMGRISPWVLYSSEKALDMLSRLEPGQLDVVARSIDVEWWKKKINKNPEEIKWINAILR